MYRTHNYKKIVLASPLKAIHLSNLPLTGVSGLRGLQITIPEAVPTGDMVRLNCDYELEKEQLYSIKWYWSDQEFYRYVPKESPPTKVFPLHGIHVDVSTMLSWIIPTCSRFLGGCF